MMLLLAYESEISLVGRKVLDYDREVSRLRSRSVSTTIEKCLDYDREDSQKKKKKFFFSFSSRLPLSRSFSIEKVIDLVFMHLFIRFASS